MARNLIVLRCGQKSLHRHWLGDGGRNWDIVLVPYEDVDAAGAPCAPTMPGMKWPALSSYLSSNPDWKRYDYICLPDDDILTDTTTWSDFFDNCDRLQSKLAAPALTPDSFFSHLSSLQNTSFVARSTTFVEIMNPCFSREFLEDVLPTFALSRSGFGFGLDMLWASMLDYRDLWIVDATPVRHTRPVGSARQPDLVDLGNYELRFIHGLGVGWATHSLGGITLDGKSVDFNSKSFAELHRAGLAHVERHHPMHWCEVGDFVPNAPPKLAEEFRPRLRAALAHLCEPIAPASRGRPCRSSSVSEWSWSLDPCVEATGANDGLINGVCGFHTAMEVNPWWEVDLQQTHLISSVVIYNRLDFGSRCRDLDVLNSIDGRRWKLAFSKCDGETFGGADGNPLRVEISPAVAARLVRIQLKGKDYLHLDQVEIFGEPIARELGDDPDSGGSWELGVESVVSFERLLADPRGQFLIEKALRNILKA